LGPESRIRRRSEFEQVYRQGARLHGRFMTVFLLPGRSMGRLGIAASRKVGSAVRRNRAKRLAREVFRTLERPPGVDIVIIPRREMLDASFDALTADYRNILRRARR
jgi:ribonuclease P protein component